ncbi:CE1 family esterase [Corynebacterium auriscanis]|uniref:alpha/beta hydrolase family esterase n=1 Tax=Corynebacterium auriscanis TaxID=99807 RepID=UPI002246FDC3|nr:PHB depolymerase family esterase [Corynebacterium auriscanis]MCX2164096.1 prolyl oligopeptidase family serine peptidase [Corynebacterium auriscanis]
MQNTSKSQRGVATSRQSAPLASDAIVEAPRSTPRSTRRSATGRRFVTGFMAASTAVALTVVPATDAPSPLANVTPSAQAQTLPGSSSATGSLGGGGNFMVQLRQILEFINGLLQIFNGGGGTLPNIPNGPSAPGTDAQTRTFNVNGASRTAIVKMPSSGKTKNLPVVFMFSGWQHTAAQARGYAALEGTGAGSDAIIVYPQGRSNAWEGAPYATTSRGEDVAFVREIVRTLANEGKVDRSRVYATGLSNGGGMALALACQAPDLMAGVVGVSGAYYNPVWSNCGSGKVPALIIHGTNDATVAYEGGTRHGAPYRSIEQMHQLVGTRNGCLAFGAPQESISGSVTTYTFSGCSAETHVKKVSGGTHTWYPLNPSAARESWSFLSKQSK